MQLIEPSFEIWDCPTAEKCLAKLERIGRLAYKSEDLIDNGRERCPSCGGVGTNEPPHYIDCPTCGERGWIQAREPTSYKFLRKILKANRRDELKAEAVRIASAHRSLQGSCSGHPSEGGEPMLHHIAKEIVDLVMDRMRDDPPHESVVEHEIITVLFNSNRGFTHELVRHRLCAFTQESTRYCNYSKGKFGKEIKVTGREPEEIDKSSEGLDEWLGGVKEAEAYYMRLIERGVKPEIARDLLPQVLLAPIVCTANLRQWRHIFNLRCSPRAHPDMRRLMIPLREELRKRIPIIFDEV